MADKEKHIIKIQGKLIEVSEDVYYAYFHMERQERTQEEKQQRNEVLAVIPLMLIYPLLQKYLISGIVLGAVKE